MNEIVELFDNGLPVGWELVPIKKLAIKHRAGGTPQRSNASYWDNGEIPYAKIQDITRAQLYLASVEERITQAGLKNSSAWIVPPESVLVSMYATVGDTAINTIPLATNQAILALILRTGIDNRFVAYSIKYYRNILLRQNVESTQKNVNKAILGNFPLPIPPFEEQRKIAYVLGTVQRAIEQQTQLIERMQELKRALMHKLFTEGTRGEPQKETEIGPMPQSWSVVPVGGVIASSRYGLSKKGAQSGQYPILRMTNQVDGYISNDDLQYVNLTDDEFEKARVEQGDILFNRTNSFELVGRSAVFTLDGDYTFASYLIRLRVDTSQIDPYFLNFYLGTDNTQARLKSIATRGVSQSNISATRLKGFPIPLPTLSEQRKINDIVRILDEKIALLQQKRRILEQLFQTLLHKLMTAQIRVHDLALPLPA